MTKKQNFNDEDYLKKAKQEIQDWEKRKPGYIAQVGDFIITPAQLAAEKLIPQSLQEQVTEAIEKVLKLLATAGEYVIDTDTIWEKRTLSPEEAGDPTPVRHLKKGDDLAKEYWNWHIGYAATEGIATGALGIFGLPADIPLILSIAIREIRSMGACYGYDTTDPSELDYLLNVLQVGSSGDLSMKAQSLIVLKDVEQALINIAWKRMAQDAGRTGAIIAAVREFARRLGIQITKRWALRLVPIISALIGGTFNAVYANDVGRAAYMCYRRRFILENKLSSDFPSSSVDLLSVTKS